MVSCSVNKTINEHFKHLIVTKKEQLFIWLTKYERLFDKSLGAWDTNTVKIELEEGAKPVCSRVYMCRNYKKLLLKKKLSV